MGRLDDRGRSDPEATAECSIPVGDYLPMQLTIDYGRLQFTLSDNYYSDGSLDRKGGRVYAIPIRKDRPLVLDFSNKPEVMFTSPAKGQTLRPGDTVRVATVVTDSGLGIMLRSLVDTSRKQRVVYKMFGGEECSTEAPLSLDPTVTITNSFGKPVSEGKMPFLPFG